MMCYNICNKIWIHDICSKLTLFYESETWVIIKRDAQKLEVMQMRLLIPLLGFTKLYGKKNMDILYTPNMTNIVEDIKLHQKS